MTREQELEEENEKLRAIVSTFWCKPKYLVLSSKEGNVKDISATGYDSMSGMSNAVDELNSGMVPKFLDGIYIRID